MAPLSLRCFTCHTDFNLLKIPTFYGPVIKTDLKTMLWPGPVDRLWCWCWSLWCDAGWMLMLTVGWLCVLVHVVRRPIVGGNGVFCWFLASIELPWLAAKKRKGFSRVLYIFGDLHWEFIICAQNWFKRIRYTVLFAACMYEFKMNSIWILMILIGKMLKEIERRKNKYMNT